MTPRAPSHALMDFYWPFPWLPPGELLSWQRGTWQTVWVMRRRGVWQR